MQKHKVGLPDGPQELVPPVPLFILHFSVFVVDSGCIYAAVCSVCSVPPSPSYLCCF